MDEIKKRKGENVVMFQRMHPNNSTCYRCGLPWSECINRSIMYETGRYVFALCEYCWEHSDIDERIHHYKSLWFDHRNRWGANYDFSVVETEIRKQSVIV